MNLKLTTTQDGGKDLPAGATVPTSENAYYQTDQIRVDEEKAVFGELYYQISDKLNLTVGHRKFDYDSKLNGFVGTIFYNPNPTMSAIGAFATDRPDNIDATLSGSDSVTKVNLSYDVSDKSMIYVSRSEGTDLEEQIDLLKLALLMILIFLQ